VLIESREFFRQLRIITAEDLMYFGGAIENYSTRPVFVMKVENFFDYVRERTVTEVVKKSAGSTDYLRFLSNRVMGTEESKRSSHHVHNAYRMCESALLGALISEHRETELSDATQSLEFGRVYEIDNKAIDWLRLIECNDVVKRISVVSLSQRFPLTGR